jgi:hypothetical protein
MSRRVNLTLGDGTYARLLEEAGELPLASYIAWLLAKRNAPVPETNFDRWFKGKMVDPEWRAGYEAARDELDRDLEPFREPVMCLACRYPSSSTAHSCGAVG